MEKGTTYMQTVTAISEDGKTISSKDKAFTCLVTDRSMMVYLLKDWRKEKVFIIIKMEHPTTTEIGEIIKSMVQDCIWASSSCMKESGSMEADMALDIISINWQKILISDNIKIIRKQVKVEWFLEMEVYMLGDY